MKTLLVATDAKRVEPKGGMPRFLRPPAKLSPENEADAASLVERMKASASLDAAGAKAECPVKAAVGVMRGQLASDRKAFLLAIEDPGITMHAVYREFEWVNLFDEMKVRRLLPLDIVDHRRRSCSCFPDGPEGEPRQRTWLDDLADEVDELRTYLPLLKELAAERGLKP